MGRHAVGRRAAARRVAAVWLLLGGLVQVAAGCWSAGCWSAGCCRSAGYWRAGWSASWSAGCGRQAASQWAAGPRATGFAWRASVVGCSAAGCLLAGCRWSAGGQSAGCRWLAGGCQSAGCWSRVATWHMRPTAAPKTQIFILRDRRDPRCRGGDKLAGGRSSSKTSPPVPLAISWEAGGLKSPCRRIW